MSITVFFPVGKDWFHFDLQRLCDAVIFLPDGRTLSVTSWMTDPIAYPLATKTGNRVRPDEVDSVILITPDGVRAIKVEPGLLSQAATHLKNAEAVLDQPVGEEYLDEPGKAALNMLRAGYDKNKAIAAALSALAK